MRYWTILVVLLLAASAAWGQHSGPKVPSPAPPSYDQPAQAGATTTPPPGNAEAGDDTQTGNGNGGVKPKLKGDGETGGDNVTNNYTYHITRTIVRRGVTVREVVASGPTVDEAARAWIRWMRENEALNGSFKNQMEVVAMLRSWGFATQDETLKAVMAELERLGYIQPTPPAKTGNEKSPMVGGTSAQPVEIVAVAPPGGSRMISLPWLITIIVAAISLIIAAYYANTHRPSLRDRNRSCTTPLDPHERGHWVLREWATPNESYRSAKPVVVALAEVDGDIEIASERQARREERQARRELVAARSHQLAMAAVASSRQTAAGNGQIVVVLDDEERPRRRRARLVEEPEDEEAERAARQARTHARQEAESKKEEEEKKAAAEKVAADKKAKADAAVAAKKKREEEAAAAKKGGGT